jgi:hypothetical protein
VRILSIVLLVCLPAVWSCGDPAGPAGDGTLVIFTATSGEAPDQDGYLLAVGAADTVALPPSGTVELALGAGEHVVRLLGAAGHCTVEPHESLEVEVTAGHRTPVGFTIDCPATGVRVTTVTTGLDLDADGYRVTVDGEIRGTVPANGTALLQLPAGEAVIGMTALTPNCTVAGDSTRAVTVVDREVAPVELHAVCVAVSGVIAVAIQAAGVDREGGYQIQVDDLAFTVDFVRPTYLSGFAPGSHVVTLDPPDNCSVATEPVTVTLTAGTTVRDTARVSFSVTCTTRQATLRVTVVTSGTVPSHPYVVNVCASGFYCEWYPYTIGTVDPNGTLVVELLEGPYDIWLEDVPERCGVLGPTSFFLELQGLVDVAYSVSCP